MKSKNFYPGNKVKYRRQSAVAREKLVEPISRVAMEAIGLGMVGAEGANAIVHQEARGQRAVIESEVLPVCGSCDADAERVLRGWGFELGDVVKGDPLFRLVKLPKGWKKLATDHAMWSDVVDDRGRKRIHVFYKAAFYDRNAHCGIVRRYAIERFYPSDGSVRAGVSVVDYATGKRRDREVSAELAAAYQAGENDGRFFRAMDELSSAAEQSLSATHPRWRESGAYWEEA